MIKKRYLLILSVAIVSILLGSLLYNNLVLAGKPVPEVQLIEITNLPLDEEGNLRVSKVAHTLNVTFAIDKHLDGVHTYTQNVSGYRQVTLGLNCTLGQVNFNIYWLVGGVEYFASQLTITNGASAAPTYEVKFETIKIEVSYTVSGPHYYSLGLYATD